jgi:hypothetical protein
MDNFQNYDGHIQLIMMHSFVCRVISNTVTDSAYVPSTGSRHSIAKYIEGVIAVRLWVLLHCINWLDSVAET